MRLTTHIIGNPFQYSLARADGLSEAKTSFLPCVVRGRVILRLAHARPEVMSSVAEEGTTTSGDALTWEIPRELCARPALLWSAMLARASGREQASQSLPEPASGY